MSTHRCSVLFLHKVLTGAAPITPSTHFHLSATAALSVTCQKGEHLTQDPAVLQCSVPSQRDTGFAHIKLFLHAPWLGGGETASTGSKHYSWLHLVCKVRTSESIHSTYSILPPSFIQNHIFLHLSKLAILPSLLYPSNPPHQFQAFYLPFLALHTKAKCAFMTSSNWISRALHSSTAR